MEAVIIGFIVVKEVTSAGIALYTGTGIVNDYLRNCREHRLREQIRIDRENARELNWEDLETGNMVEIPLFEESESDEPEEFNEREWMII